jgi:probable rRNA maturation factor
MKNSTGDKLPEKNMLRLKESDPGVAVNLKFNRRSAVTPKVVTLMERIAQLATEAVALPAAAEISVVLCDDRTIHRLNKKWRGIDAPTDVLSFPQLTETDWQKPLITQVLLGDIVLSLESAARQAKEYGHSPERELLYLFTHGLLHLLGYDHLQEDERCRMRRREEEIITAAGAPLR